MAENEAGQEKTEVATPRRRQQAREEGNVPKSMEMNTALILATGVVAFYFYAEHFYASVADAILYYMSRLGEAPLTDQDIGPLSWEVGWRVINILGPFFILFVVVSIVINIAQVGFLFVLTAVQPKFNKLNPYTGLQRVLGTRGRVELLKSVGKMLIIGPIMFITVQQSLPSMMTLMSMGLKDSMIHIGYEALDVAVIALLFMLILAIIDLVYQRWQHEQDMKMTKEEVKQENKDIQGDPQVKSRIRSTQQDMARQRMMEEVPESEVVVTNPTEYAIALKYDPDHGPAPIVVAKGRNVLARKIKEIARENNVPIVENRPLAQSLYKLVEIGGLVPPELYQAVAEVLAYVYKLSRKMGATA